MRLQRANHQALVLLLAAGLSVSSASAQAQKPAQKKSTASKSGGSSRRTKSSKKSRHRARGQKAPAPDRISEIQQALAKDGSFTGTPNGKWDASTAEAMRKFQESHGLNPTGKLDAKTLQQLGLGSPVAGVAPPLPPMGAALSNITPAQTSPHPQ
jgi:peptidoglycan hydrolase-like protein with peptidoglycan-binding domain